MSIHNIIAHMVDKEIDYKDLSGNGVVLLIGDFNLTDKQLRGLITTCMKNGHAVQFDKNKFLITKEI